MALTKIMNINKVYKYSISYLNSKLSIIPVKVKSKTPAISSWKEYQQRVPSYEEVEDWFKYTPNTNIAIVTGTVSGNLVVIDFDDKKIFDEWFESHKEIAENTWLVETARGYHVYFKLKGKIPRKFKFKGGDVQGNGAYVVAPPSDHPDEKPYNFINKTEKIFEIENLAEIDIYPENISNQSDWAEKALKGVPENYRNDTGIRLAGLWRSRGDSEDTILEKLIDWNKKNEPPLAEEDLKPIAKSAAKYEKGKKLSQKERLLHYVLESGITFFHDQIGEPFTSFATENHREIINIGSKKFDLWLSHIFLEKENIVINSGIKKAVKDILAAKAIFEGQEKKLWNRVTEYNGSFWYDLADKKWSAIKTDELGWKLIGNPPVLFVRYPHQSPQVTPSYVENPSNFLEELFKFINIKSRDNRLLLKVYLVSSFIPDFPHPILVLHGDKGSGKTFSFKLLKMLIDPSQVEVSTLQTDISETIQNLYHHWISYFDNISSIPIPVQDALCRGCTGEAFSKRELFTNQGDIIFKFQRCIGLNGIDLSFNRPDLMDRSIIFDLERFERTKPEKILIEEFEKIKPKILGAIFTILSKAISYHKKNVSTTFKFRMADFAHWGLAITNALGYKEENFLKAYGNQVKRTVLHSLYTNPLGQAIQSFVNKNLQEEKEWKGTPTELYNKLNKIANQEKIDTNSKLFPSGANWMWRRLREIKVDLQQTGIVVKNIHSGKQREITISILDKENKNTISSFQIHKGII